MSRSFVTKLKGFANRWVGSQPRGIVRTPPARRLRIESLEARRLLTYTFAYNPVSHVATATGTAAVDSLVIEQVGGLLEHSVDGSAFDSNWGGNTVPASALTAVSIDISTGDGSALTLGTPASPASTFGGTSFDVAAVVNTLDTTTIDDSTGTTVASGAKPYSIDTLPGNISGPGFSYNQGASGYFQGGVVLMGSPVDGDIYNVLSVCGGVLGRFEPMTIIPASTTTSTVNVGSGGTLNVASPLSIYDSGATAITTLNINDASDTTDATATLDNLSGNANAPYEVKGLSASPIEYGAGVTALNIYGGTSAGGTAGVTYNLNGTQPGTTTSINGGSGSNTLQGSEITNATLTGSSAGGFSGVSGTITFSNISSLAGNGSGTLTGENTAATWNLGATNTYVDAAGNTLTFSGFPTLQAGTAKTTFVVDLPDGATAPAGGIAFIGNGTSSILEVVGSDTTSAGQTVTYLPSNTTPGSGEVLVAGNTSAISFSGLTPVYFNGLNTVTVAIAAGDQKVKITNSTVPGTPSLEIAPDGAPGVAFEYAYVWNDANVTVDTTANAGMGAVRVVSADCTNASGAMIPNFSIKTGGAADTISIQGEINSDSNVSLTALQSSITETAPAGFIIAGSLRTGSMGGTTLLSTGNQFGKYSGSENGGGAIQIYDAQALSVGIAPTGINDIGGAVSLTSLGMISQTQSIFASSLATSSVGGTTLPSTGNQFGSYSGSDNGGTIQIYDALGLSVGVAAAGIADGSGAVSLMSAGTIMQTQPIVAMSLATVSVGGTTLLSTSNQFASYSGSESGGAIQIYDALALSVGVAGTGIADGGGAVGLMSAGTIMQTQPIVAVSLATVSVGGTTLGDAANMIGSFNATNTASGSISLTNTAGPLTITGISIESGGNVTVMNTGALTTAATVTTAGSGSVSLTSTGTETVNAAVTASGSGTVTLDSTGGGLYLNSTVTTGSGMLTLTAGGGSLLVGAAVGSTSGTVNATASGSLLVDAEVSSPAGINATAGGSITESGSGYFSTSGLLTTMSGSGQTLTGAGPNAVGSFNATNTTSNSISLTNTASTLTITGISNTAPNGNVTVSNAGALTTSGAVTTTANGSISLISTGTETIGAAVTAGGSGTVTLSATGGSLFVNGPVSSTSGPINATASAAITESASGGFSTSGLLTTSSASGQTLGTFPSSTSPNAVGSFNATNTTTGNVQLNNSANPLTVTGISESGGGNVTVGNTGNLTTMGAVTTANGNINLNSRGTETIGAAVTAGGSGTVTLTAIGGSLLVNGSVSTVANGNIFLTSYYGAAVTIGAAVTAGGSGQVDLESGSGDLLINAPVISTSGPIEAVADLSLSESGIGYFSTSGLLTTVSSGGQLLTTAGPNSVGSFYAVNTGGSINLWDMSPTGTLTIYNGIFQSGGGNVTVSNTNITVPNVASALTVQDAVTATGDGNITLIADGGSLLVSALVGSDSGNIYATAATTAVTNTAAITESDDGYFSTSGLLTTVSASGQLLTLAGPNSVGSFNATNSSSGNVNLWDLSPTGTLTVTGISETGGFASVSNTNLTVSNDPSALTITGTVSAAGNGNIVLIASGGSMLVESLVGSASGAINATAAPNAATNSTAAITESGVGYFSTSGLLTTVSTAGQTLVGGGPNSVGSFNATNTGGNVNLWNMTTPTLTITGVSETGGGTATASNTSGINLPAADTISATGGVTLNVGSAGGGSSSVIAGTIDSGTSGSPIRALVQGTGGGNVLNVQLAAAPQFQFYSAGLVFNGGSIIANDPNVLNITDPAGVPTNYYTVDEGASGGNVFHGTAASPTGYDARLGYDFNVQKLEINGNGGSDNATVELANVVNTTATPLLPQFFLNATNPISTLQIDASVNSVTATQQYAIGPIGSIPVGGLAPNLALSSLMWTAGAPNPVTNSPALVPPLSFALPASVPQTFSINDVALLQCFGGAGSNDCVINNTSTNSLMVAGGTSATSTSLIGGLGENELLGGLGAAQLFGRGVLDYVLSNYTIGPPSASTSPNYSLVPATPPNSGGYVYEWPAGIGFVSNGNNPLSNNSKTVVLSNSGALTTSDWLEATIVSQASIVSNAQSAIVLQVVARGPNVNQFV